MSWIICEIETEIKKKAILSYAFSILYIYHRSNEEPILSKNFPDKVHRRCPMGLSWSCFHALSLLWYLKTIGKYQYGTVAEDFVGPKRDLESWFYWMRLKWSLQKWT